MHLNVLDKVEVPVDHVLDGPIRDQWVCGAIVDDVSFVAVEDLCDAFDVSCGDQCEVAVLILESLGLRLGRLLCFLLRPRFSFRWLLSWGRECAGRRRGVTGERCRIVFDFIVINLLVCSDLEGVLIDAGSVVVDGVPLEPGCAGYVDVPFEQWCS